MAVINFPFFREAREEQLKRIATVDETASDVYSYTATPQLTVLLPEATPEAFKMVLNYIYMDRIDPTEKGKMLIRLNYVRNLPKPIMMMKCGEGLIIHTSPTLFIPWVLLL